MPINHKSNFNWRLVAENTGNAEAVFNLIVKQAEAVMSEIIVEERSSPPVSPADGDVYYIPSLPTPTGLFSDHAKSFALYCDGSYIFHRLGTRVQVYNQDTGLLRVTDDNDNLVNGVGPAPVGPVFIPGHFKSNAGSPAQAVDVYTNFSVDRWRLKNGGLDAISIQFMRPLQFDDSASIDLEINFITKATEASKILELEATIYQIGDGVSVNGGSSESKTNTLTQDFTADEVESMEISGIYSTLTIGRNDLLVLVLKRLNNTYAGHVDILNVRMTNQEPLIALS